MQAFDGNDPTLGQSLKKVLHAYDLWPQVLNPGVWETCDFKIRNQVHSYWSEQKRGLMRLHTVSRPFPRWSSILLACAQTSNNRCWHEGPRMVWSIPAWLRTGEPGLSLGLVGPLTHVAQFRARSSSFLVAVRHSTVCSIQIFIGSVLREEKHHRLLGKERLLLHTGVLPFSQTTRRTQLSIRQACFNNPARQLGFLLLPS